MLATALLLTVMAADSVSLEISRRAEAIYWKLNCPVCAGQNVAESNSPVAKEMRALVRQMLREGKSEEEILAYFVERYGEWILTVPPSRGVNRLLWWLPPLVLIAGGGVVYGFYRFARSRTPTTPPPPPPPQIREKIQALLEAEEEDDEASP